MATWWSPDSGPDYYGLIVIGESGHWTLVTGVLEATAGKSSHRHTHWEWSERRQAVWEGTRAGAFRGEEAGKLRPTRWHMASLPPVKDFDYGPGSGDRRDCQAFLTPKGQIPTFPTACVHPKSSPGLRGHLIRMDTSWAPGLALPDPLFLGCLAPMF